jgi:microsomal epoxide hydrolase
MLTAGLAMRTSFEAAPFRVDVPQAVLDDLQERLASTRWPNEPRDAAWRYGTNLGWMKEVAAYWMERYDWRRNEARLNRFEQFVTVIDGQGIHFMLERGSGLNPMPLLITHGWPGSVVEFLHVIEPLAHPERFGGSVADAFTVVAPSIPGFGFSPPPPAPVTTRQVAGLWHKLMADVLGCRRYAAQGGDYGASITSWLALDHPEPLPAIHLNMVSFIPRLSEDAPADAEELAWLKANEARRAPEMAYMAIQGTKPQTLSYGLTDSPVGMAAWILEKFHAWTVPGSKDPPPFDLEDLLTNVMLYWVNGINPANWMYVPLQDPANRQLPPGRRVEVPTGVLLCPNDVSLPAPEQWIRRAYNVVHRRVASSGGHFAALELGQQFVSEVQSFYRPYRS